MSQEKTASQIVEEAFMGRLAELEVGEAKLAHLARTSPPFNKLAKAYGLVDEGVAVTEEAPVKIASHGDLVSRLRAAIAV